MELLLPVVLVGGGRRISWVGLEKSAARCVAWEEWGESARRRFAGGGGREVIVDLLCFGGVGLVLGGVDCCWLFGCCGVLVMGLLVAVMWCFGVESCGLVCAELEFEVEVELRRDWQRSLGARWKFKWAGLLFEDAALAAGLAGRQSQPLVMYAATKCD